ncbi:alpha-galactosidase [Clostridium polyendosporum]|uniref:Alpha-galactosidase n=1 Tax=Clostridium polyendosporum TaxID=69208 RepID=A0A919RZ75_9CLOT|nr:alpha-galactosidase [Clostridium polyendosporum]GIM28195.1 alpha-galactosidase [Clostridium polyendosporum]
MGIEYNEKSEIFHLKAKDTSYIMELFKSRYVASLYWGKKIRSSDVSRILQVKYRSFSPDTDPSDRTFSLDTLPQEYPAYGNSDFRSPAYQIQLNNGSTISNAIYKQHKIFQGKAKLEGLPSTYVEAEYEAQTLEIELFDELIRLSIILSYTVYENFDVITRSVRFINRGQENIKILRALSMNVDFKDDYFDFLQLSGAHTRERQVQRRSLVTGIHSIESRRGASSHQENPFIALLRKDSNEHQGEAYGFSFVYSGNFLAQVEVDQYRTSRVSVGINPFDFSWLLEPGQCFQTPEVVMVYSDCGLNKMSQTYHKLYRTRLCRGKYRDRIRPILINNWEATYFNFNSEILLNLAKEAKELGIELFVLDDGWFSQRNSDTCCLGDWFVNKAKIPEGLYGLSNRINNLGMEFGLWVEPEMVSPNSELYKNHPDWVIHVPNRPRSESRNQLILDLSRKEVCDMIIKVISDILASANISYVKWDMNRNMTEIGSASLPPERQRETAHRYMLGLYRILDKITSTFPDILFESCSGGGGRFDPGMLYYMPQVWTSDNTDAIARLGIQYGTSIVYPQITMGAHVSAVPNHQTQRITSLKIRGDVAMSANLGYEVDLTKLVEVEKKIIKQQVTIYKDMRELVQFGIFYRLLSPFEGNETAWMIVSENKAEFVVYYYRVLAEANAPFSSLRLKGLDPEIDYQLVQMDYNILSNGEIYGGDELMYAGINIPELQGDFQSVIWRFERPQSNSIIIDNPFRYLKINCPYIRYY